METEQLNTCPRCGNFCTSKLEKEIEVEEDMYDAYNEYAGFVYNNYYVFKCTSCGQASIYAYFFAESKDKRIDELELIYPNVRNNAWVLPKNVKKSYLEAKKIQNISPVSFAILIRKCLEQICIDQGANGNNLAQKILNLIEISVLPDKIGELATLIRKLGNISAHDADELDRMDVDVIDEFFHTVADYIYSIDGKIEMIKEKWEMNQNKQNTG